MSLEARLRPRPLSPHLAIYRRTITMMSSIAHRLTAAANVPLALLLIAFVVALTSADYANLANGVTMQLIATRIYHDFDPKAGEEYELRDRLFRTGERSFVLIVAGELPGDLKSKSRSVSQACLVGMLS